MQRDLSNREIRTFVHNAQLALCDVTEDKWIPVVYAYKQQLVKELSGSRLPPHVLAAVLVSAAWEVLRA